MQNIFSNFLCFTSPSKFTHLSSISNNFNCNAREMKPRIYRRHPLELCLASKLIIVIQIELSGLDDIVTSNSNRLNAKMRDY